MIIKSLWDKEDLVNEKIKVEPKLHTDYDIQTSDTFEENAKIVNIEADLKLSVLAGLVDLGGSAKYMNHTNSNSKVRSVTYKKHSTTETKVNHNHLLSPTDHFRLLSEIKVML